MTLALSGERPLREPHKLADKFVMTAVERSPGVGDVNPGNGLGCESNILEASGRLEVCRLPITTVREAVAWPKANIPGGSASGPLRDETLRPMGRYTEARRFNELVITTRNGSPIRVSDMGWAEDGTKEQRSISRLYGVSIFSLDLVRQSGANQAAARV